MARQTVESMLDAARVTPGTRVLDICCGPGMLAAGALKRGADAVEIDFSTEAVELARSLVPGGRFEKATHTRCRFLRRVLMPFSAATA